MVRKLWLNRRIGKNLLQRQQLYGAGRAAAHCEPNEFYFATTGSPPTYNTRIPAGSDNQYLRIVSKVPAWASVLTTATNVLSGDVSLNNTANYFDGPSMAQGTTGTWWIFGEVTLQDTAGGAAFNCKLWDGTNASIDSRATVTAAANNRASIALGGYVASPAGNMRISCKDATSTSGKILFNNTGNSTDSTIWGIRINYLLRRNLDPANDNVPLGLSQVA